MGERRGRAALFLSVAALLAVMVAASWLLIGCQEELPPMGGEQTEAICTWCRAESRFFFGGDIRFYSDEHSTQTLLLEGGTGDIDSEGDANYAGDLSVGNGTPDTTLNGEDAYVEGTFEVDGAVNLDGAVDMASTLTVGGVTTVPTDTEHIGLMTIDAVAVISDTDGAIWTVGEDEIWFVYAVYCEITTNFDCDGDDCTLTIGDGNDADGFLVLIDAEMQTDDAEFTGAPAGWKGLHTDSMGAYLSGLAPFVYDGTDTIDIAIDDTGATDPTAGAATCYIVYIRVQ